MNRVIVLVCMLLLSWCFVVAAPAAGEEGTPELSYRLDLAEPAPETAPAAEPAIAPGNAAEPSVELPSATVPESATPEAVAPESAARLETAPEAPLVAPAPVGDELVIPVRRPDDAESAFMSEPVAPSAPAEPVAAAPGESATAAVSEEAPAPDQASVPERTGSLEPTPASEEAPAPEQSAAPAQAAVSTPDQAGALDQTAAQSPAQAGALDQAAAQSPEQAAESEAEPVDPAELTRRVRESRLDQWAAGERPYAGELDLEWGEAVALTDLLFLHSQVLGLIEGVSGPACRLDAMLVKAAELLSAEGATSADAPEAVWAHYAALSPSAGNSAFIRADAAFNRQTGLPLTLSFTLLDEQLPDFLPSLDELAPGTPLLLPFVPLAPTPPEAKPEETVPPLLLYRQAGDLVVLHARYETPDFPGLPLNIVSFLYMENVRAVLAEVEKAWPDEAAAAEQTCAEHLAGLQPAPWPDTPAAPDGLKLRKGAPLEDISGVWRTAGATTTIVLDLLADQPSLLTTGGELMPLHDLRALNDEDAVEAEVRIYDQSASLRYEIVPHPLLPKRYHLRQVLRSGDRVREDNFYKE